MKPQLPSIFKEQMKLWKGHKILTMTRLLKDDPESIPSLYNIPKSKIFSLFSAPLILELSNQHQFGVKVNPGQASIMICETNFQADEGNFNDTKFHLIPLSSSDLTYSEEKFSNINNLEIQDISIYVRIPKNKKIALRAREAGIGVTLANSKKLVFSCGLHDGSDDFSVIFSEDIPNDLKQELEETGIF